MLPQEFLRTSHLPTMRLTQVSHQHHPLAHTLCAPSPCCMHTSIHRACTATSGKHRVPELPTGRRNWDSHRQDGTWMFCNPPSTENSESCFPATLFYAHPCCRNYTVLLFIGIMLFLFMQRQKFIFNGSSIFRCPSDDAFPLL